MKDVLWCGLLKLDVPHEGDAVRLVRSVFVIVVGGNQQLRVLSKEGRSGQHRGRAGNRPVWPHLGGPVQAGDDAMLGPVLIIEEPAQRQAGPRAQVSEQRDKVDFSLAGWPN